MNNEEHIDKLAQICNAFVHGAKNMEGEALEMQREYIQSLRYAIAVLTTKEAER